MGKHMAPPNANLFIGQLEKKALENYPHKPHLWLRYIGDIFMVCTHGEEKYLCTIDPTKKFNSERSTTSIPFLDVTIHVHDGKMQTDLLQTYRQTPTITSLLQPPISHKEVYSL